MRDVLREIEVAGASHGGVTLVGEPGTGRGLVARAVHECTYPHGAPFVAVYCNKADLSSLEVELFGTTLGAGQRASLANGPFQPPAQTHERIAPGSLLHRARGGTIYFVHIEDLPDRVQARLAHLFRDREAIVFPNKEPEAFNVRPMTAVDAHQGAAAADEARIRPDLYKRLAGITIAMPPLRERREDIPGLALFFVERACRQRRLPGKTLAQSVLAVLGALPWKGNARELMALVESLALKADGPEIGLDALLSYVRLDHPAPDTTRVKTSGATLRQARLQFERDYISAVLAQHRGRIPEAAKALGIQRTNLYRKLRSLQLARPHQALPAHVE
jgi:DNA-binding NtrC family response regulator